MTDPRPCPMNFNCEEMGLESGRCRNLSACITWSDSFASRQIDHHLYKQDGLWHCSVCGYIWRSKPQSICPRAPQYGPNRPYPGVAATKTELQKMGLMATRLPVGVAYSRAGKKFYDLYDLKAVRPLPISPKLRIFRVCRLWQGKLVGVDRTWKGFPEGAGWLEGFYTYEEAQQELTKLREAKLSRRESRPLTPPEETWELQHIPGLPDEIYALVSSRPVDLAPLE